MGFVKPLMVSYGFSTATGRISDLEVEVHQIFLTLQLSCRLRSKYLWMSMGHYQDSYLFISVYYKKAKVKKITRPKTKSKI